MKIKTSELTGAALDWAVAKCEGYQGNASLKRNNPLDDGALEHLWLKDYTPSTNWAQGGPIIEREKIAVWFSKGDWKSQMRDTRAKMHGPTPLEAAMRCYVASKLGEDVSIPEELK
jgi:hypothetical protein